MEGFTRVILWVIIVIVVVAGLAAWLAPNLVGLRGSGVQSPSRFEWIGDWLENPAMHPEWAIRAGERCPGAPFQIPTDGYVGFLWDDSFRVGHRHQGIDIFGGEAPGITPVYAAADGYLTRMADWKSSLIIRLPEDPLQPGRQVWTYYTHLANDQGESLIVPDFPPGAEEIFVRAGTLLGTQGNYSGTPGNPVGVHLHFSIVLDDGAGKFRNELDINNTLDPSPYLGINLNAHKNQNEIPVCSPASNEGEP
jgi:hypothetical protein